MRPFEVSEFEAEPLVVPLIEPFAIATGAKTEARNVLVRIRLKSGICGFGEGAASAAAGDWGEREALDSARGAAPLVLGRDIRRWRALLAGIGEKGPRLAYVRAAVEMAVLDAFARHARVPLWSLLGGAGSSVTSDVTVTLGSPEAAFAAARRIRALGVRTIKIKVGSEPGMDLKRVLAVRKAAPQAEIFLDANQGYETREAVAFARALKARGILPTLYEQPVSREDLAGMAEVHRRTGIPVAADESAQGAGDLLRLSRLKAAQVVNIKLMKCGLLESLRMAELAKALGMGLMIGGMIESSLAMTAAAHMAAGLGGFGFVDLDTPLWFKSDPMRGARIGKGGLYDLSKVRSGIGVTPKSWPPGTRRRA